MSGILRACLTFDLPGHPVLRIWVHGHELCRPEDVARDSQGRCAESDHDEELSGPVAIELLTSSPTLASNPNVANEATSAAARRPASVPTGVASVPASWDPGVLWGAPSVRALKPFSATISVSALFGSGRQKRPIYDGRHDRDPAEEHAHHREPVRVDTLQEARNRGLRENPGKDGPECGRIRDPLSLKSTRKRSESCFSNERCLRSVVWSVVRKALLH